MDDRSQSCQGSELWVGQSVKLVKRKEKEKLLPVVWSVVSHCGREEGWAPTLQAGKPGPEV